MASWRELLKETVLACGLPPHSWVGRNPLAVAMRLARKSAQVHEISLRDRPQKRQLKGNRRCGADKVVKGPLGISL
jgi:hypothetical protein